MSKRGLQYNHTVGDHVLCFEPDPKKVRVIYPAKVMEHAVRKRSDSPHRIAAYRVHFQGWKASWDREVTEEMLLPDSPFNRELMFRIDDITRRTRRIEEVRERIDKVLTHVRRLRQSPNFPATPEEEETFDWSQVDGIMPPLPQPQDNRGRKERARKGSTDARDDSDEEEDATTAEKLEVHASFVQSLTLPPLLRRVLEVDQRRVQADAAANLSLDGGPSLLRFLEDFLAQVSSRPARPTQQTVPGSTAAWTEEYARADRSLRLAYEVASSLRILTDVLFQDELLYPRERALFHRQANSPRRRHAATAAINAINHRLPEPDPPAIQLLPPDVKSKAELPSASCPVVILLRLIVLLPDLLDSMKLSLCRRAIISRHVVRLIKYMENSVSSWFPHPVDEENGSEADVTANTTAASSSRRRKRTNEVKR